MSKIASGGTTVPVMRNAHSLIFTQFLRTQGMPVTGALRRAKLPLLCQDPSALVPTERVWRYFEIIDDLGIEGIGWAVGEASYGMGLNSALMSRLRTSPTPYAAVLLLSKLAAEENSHIRVGVLEGRHDLLFWIKCAFCSRQPGYHHAQAYGLMVALAVLRLFFGKDWTPLGVAIEAGHVPEAVVRILEDVPIKTSQRVGYIRLPRHLLARTTIGLKGSEIQSTPAVESPTPLDELGLAETLERIVESYLREWCPTIEQAAEMVGVSSRTLRRRLAAENRTYAGLVQRARLKISHRLLDCPDINIIDVASAAGYGDPAHFSRAFRRTVGMTPSDYRRLSVQAD